jgi:hypothetical protein
MFYGVLWPRTTGRDFLILKIHFKTNNKKFCAMSNILTAVFQGHPDDAEVVRGGKFFLGSFSPESPATRCQCYKTFFSSLQKTRPNKLECLYLAITFQSSLTFAGNTRSLPKKEASERSSDWVCSGKCFQGQTL